LLIVFNAIDRQKSLRTITFDIEIKVLVFVDLIYSNSISLIFLKKLHFNSRKRKTLLNEY